MNREIKFRAWNKKEKYMEPVDDLQMFSNQLSIGMLSKDYFLGKDDVELMQYTGLHDKNRKEIYEGDILQISDVDKAIVEWSNKYASFILKPIGDYYFDNDVLGCSTEHNDLIEVIGNLYDNPNLVVKE